MRRRPVLSALSGLPHSGGRLLTRSLCWAVQWLRMDGGARRGTKMSALGPPCELLTTGGTLCAACFLAFTREYANRVLRAARPDNCCCCSWSPCASVGQGTTGCASHTVVVGMGMGASDLRWIVPVRLGQTQRGSVGWAGRMHVLLLLSR